MRRLVFAAGRLTERVHAVRAWLEDVNGPRGGVDKRCAIEIRGALGVRRADVRDTDFYAAVDRAVHTAARTLARHQGSRGGRRVRALVPYPIH